MILMSLGINLYYKMGMIVGPCNPNTWEVEAGGSQQVSLCSFYSWGIVVLDEQ